MGNKFAGAFTMRLDGHPALPFPLHWGTKTSFCSWSISRNKSRYDADFVESVVSLILARMDIFSRDAHGKYYICTCYYLMKKIFGIAKNEFKRSDQFPFLLRRNPWKNSASFEYKNK